MQRRWVQHFSQQSLYASARMGARNRCAPSIHHNKWIFIAFSHSYSPAIAESYAGAFAYSH